MSGNLKDLDNLTPMMRQYQENKARHPDAILLFRMGDFYEMFFDDAKKASRLLDIALTTRDKNKEEPVPMCGFPHHSASVVHISSFGSGAKSRGLRPDGRSPTGQGDRTPRSYEGPHPGSDGRTGDTQARRKSFCGGPCTTGESDRAGRV